MSFLECIQTAVETGRLGAGKGEEASQAYQDALDQGIKEGLSPDAAEAGAAMRALEQTTQLTYAKRKERIAEMRVQHRNYERIMASSDPYNELAGHSFLATNSSLMDEAQMTYSAVRGQLLALMPASQLQWGPKMAGLRMPTDNMDDALRGTYGEAVDEGAARFAEEAKLVQEQIRVMTNLEGANIPANPNHRFWQTHDRFSVREVGEDQWVKDHLADGVLDWTIMRFDGKEIPVEAREGILRQTYQSIITEGRNKVAAGRSDATTLANRLSRERFLYYATADGWIAMNEKYGAGNFYNQLINHIDSAARNIALMRTFGPNPEAGKEFAKRAMRVRAAEDMKVGGRVASDIANREAKEIIQADQQYDILARNVDLGQGDALVQHVASARSLIGTSLLGTVIASTLGDAFHGMFVRYLHRMPFLHVIPQYFSDIASRKAMVREGIDMGVAWESLSSMAIDSQPYNVASEGSAAARRLSEFNYRVQGAADWTQRGRAASGFDFAKNLARGQGKSLDKLPFGQELMNLGITQRDWDLVREVPLYEPQYYNFGKAQMLRPIDMYQHAATDEAREAANKFLMAQESFVRTSVPGPTIRARQFLGGAVSQRTWAGFILSNASQLALFPASIMFNQWRMIARQSTTGGKLRGMASFFLFTTAAGAVTATVKDLLMGKEPPDYTDPKFLGRAMALGGGGAILGDFLYNNVGAINDYYASGTPTDTQSTKFIKGIAETYKEVFMDGADAEPLKAWGDFAWGLMPKPAPFKLIMEREINDTFLEYADPAAYQRKIDRQTENEMETGQGMWWGTGE